ncbi:MAG: hypothetical protein KDB18_04300 [Salinibacterium sp.]|nr:hypothetical protein [Salinibacterium sp.]
MQDQPSSPQPLSIDQGTTGPAQEQGRELEATQTLPPPVGSPSLLSETMASGLMVVGVLGLVFILFRNIRRQKQKESQFDVPAKERLQSIRSEAASTNDLHGMTARAQESVQTLITQLENKAVRLEALLDRAEAKISEYEARLERAEPVSPPPSPVPASENPSPLPIDPLHRRVHALADQGLDPVEIARQVDRPTGQIELILALRRA